MCGCEIQVAPGGGGVTRLVIVQVVMGLTPPCLGLSSIQENFWQL